MDRGYRRGLNLNRCTACDKPEEDTMKQYESCGGGRGGGGGEKIQVGPWDLF